MNFSLRRVAGPTIAGLGCSLVLAACGGGGGTAPSGPVVTAPQPVAPKATTRATMQSTFVAYQQATSFTSNGVSTAFGAVRRVQAIHQGRRPRASAPVCSNGRASVGPVDNPDGSQTYTDYRYYDAACVHLAQADVTTITQNTASAIAASSVVTTYDQSGNVTSYTVTTIRGTLNGGSQTFTLTGTVANSPTAPWFAKVGLTCAGPIAGPGIACGVALVDTVNGTQLGAAVNETVSVTAGPQGETASALVSASAYAAPSGLDIAPVSIPSWNVTGAAPLDSVFGNMTISTNASGTTSGTISLSDGKTGITVTGTVTSTSETFVVAQNGTLLAGATVDPLGNGTISYGDGTSEKITHWQITG